MNEQDSYYMRMLKMNGLIANRCTGTPDEFAAKMDMNLGNLYYQLEKLKSSVGRYGVKVLYNQRCRTYEYDRPGKMKIIYFWEE